MTVGRVSDVLRRIEENITINDVVKTCFGILSILSREEANKQLIFKDGLDLILNAMNMHIEKIDVQEVGCELLWSLAFKNNAVKDMIAKFGGTLILVRALKRHSRSSEFLKNACGALSNICQCRINQESIAAQGGLPPLVASVHAHIENPKLLPFIFDAIASLIVSNDDNGRTVSSLGIVPLVITALGKYSTSTEVSKSGCHTLAILTDVKGQASKISYAGGVSSILSLLNVHAAFVELHRVAFVVLLRMLQESIHVSRDIVQCEGVRILLESLRAGGAQDDTVAAVTHILFTVTNPSSALTSLVETQLWQPYGPAATTTNEPVDELPKIPTSSKLGAKQSKSGAKFQSSALGGLVKILATYADRKDVVKSSVRVLNNVLHFSGVAIALNSLAVFDTLLNCLAKHEEVKDIPDSVVTMLKHLALKRMTPTLDLRGEQCIQGFLVVFRAKLADEDAMEYIAELAVKVLLVYRALPCESKRLTTEQVEQDVYSLIHRRIQRLNEATSEGPLKKPLRYLSSLLAVLDYFVQHNLALCTEIIAEGSVLEQMTLVVESLPAVHNDIKHKIQSLRQRVRSSEDAADDVPTETAISRDVSEDGAIQIVPVMAVDVESSSSGRRVECKSQLGRALLDCSPSQPEYFLSPISVAAALSLRNSVTSYDRMQLIYESASAAGIGIQSKVSIEDLPYEAPPIGSLERGAPFSHSLTFDSEFESGNLFRAVQRDTHAYDLFLRSDLHTSGHTQWFYFAVSNTHTPVLQQMATSGLPIPPARIKFCIINLTKPDSLFNLGMQPVMYSYHNAATKGIGWVRAGSDICYYANQFPRQNKAGEGENTYYTLSFTMEFPNANDTYLLAYTYPYTYRDYNAHIDRLLSVPGADAVIHRTKLCKTLGGFDCDLVTITNFHEKRLERIGPISLNAANVTPRRSKGDVKVAKPCLVFSARVHPGETQASWMMRGMLEYLVSDLPAAQLLRELYVIFIIPMLNIDGVVFGNSRCGLAGSDLNRMWRSPTPQHPSIFAMKSFMMAQKKSRDIAMFIDLHGHTRKHNVFMYGCGPTKKTKVVATAFPKFLSLNKVGKKFFSFSDCSFHVKKSRETTARVVVCKEIGVSRSYTLEATFSGPNFGEMKQSHMHIGHFLEVGASLCESIALFSLSQSFAREFNLALDALPINLPKEFDSSAADELNLDDIENDDMSSGSDDDDEGGAQQQCVSKSADALDKLIISQQTTLALKVKNAAIISKSSSARKDSREENAESLPVRRAKENLRLQAGKSALASNGKKVVKHQGPKRNSITIGDQHQGGEDFMRKLDTSLLSHTLAQASKKSK